jgi:hypothetical protein
MVKAKRLFERIVTPIRVVNGLPKRGSGPAEL